jgi:hypothetical protein
LSRDPERVVGFTISSESVEFQTEVAMIGPWSPPRRPSARRRRADGSLRRIVPDGRASSNRSLDREGRTAERPFVSRAAATVSRRLVLALAIFPCLVVPRFDSSAAPTEPQETALAATSPPPSAASPTSSAADAAPSPDVVAQEVDTALAALSEANGLTEVPRASDSELLRRASLALTGRSPAPSEVASFVLDPDEDKLSHVVESLLASKPWAHHQARYWSDAILYRAQDPRAQSVRRSLVDWLEEGFRSGRPWSEVVTDIITATGPVAENGATGLIVAQMGQAEALAAETSRLFLGIQMQCAECHDHPYDSWKRTQFHELAAFFPRVRLQRGGSGPRSFVVNSIEAPTVKERQNRRQALRGEFLGNPEDIFARFDKDSDEKLSPNEIPPRLRVGFERLLRLADQDKDAAVSRLELERAQEKQEKATFRGEHHMPDLERPDAPGTLMQPIFFVDGSRPPESTPDEERRGALARLVTSPENPWFARAFVQRVWYELIGRAFVEPVDDLGPGRDVQAIEALDALARGFTRSGHDVRWLFRTITRTAVFRRASRPRDSAESRYFAAPSPAPLGSGALIDGLARALGLEGVSRGTENTARRGTRGAALRPDVLDQLFGFDPSTPPDDVAMSIPQALFLMNSPAVERNIDAQRGVLAQIPESDRNSDSIIEELYLRVLSRKPTEREIESCRAHFAQTPNRDDALEDIYWCLINTHEFATKR